MTYSRVTEDQDQDIFTTRGAHSVGPTNWQRSHCDRTPASFTRPAASTHTQVKDQAHTVPRECLQVDQKRAIAAREYKHRKVPRECGGDRGLHWSGRHISSLTPGRSDPRHDSHTCPVTPRPRRRWPRQQLFAQGPRCHEQQRNGV